MGRYEVLLRLARGGMGTVYLCRASGEGGFRRLFALKVIRDHLCRNAAYVQMMLQEARIASRLHHPNVVGIVDIGVFADQHYLVLEYVEGCTFAELLAFHPKSRPPQLVIPIVLDALTGLHAAHTLADDDGRPLGLVHCDVSPQNMLVGTNGTCRITDFGIARAADVLPDRSITRGKPAYLSPEQILGQPVDHRADIFAAGVVLWNALTGEQLFSGETPEAVVEAVLHADIPPPSTVGLRPPACLDRICLRALRRDPAARYPSAEAMLVDLRRVAIAEGLLGASSEVSAWVRQTFGHRLEQRRRAAGLSAAVRRNGAPQGHDDPTQLGDGAVPFTEGSTSSEGPSASHTAMLRPRSAGDAATHLLHRQRTVVLALAGAVASMAIAVAWMRPDWIRGGFVDEYGTYLDYEPAPAIRITPQAEANESTPAPREARPSDTPIGPPPGQDSSPAPPASDAAAAPTPPAPQDVPTSPAEPAAEGIEILDESGSPDEATDAAPRTIPDDRPPPSGTTAHRGASKRARTRLATAKTGVDALPGPTHHEGASPDREPAAHGESAHAEDLEPPQP